MSARQTLLVTGGAGFVGSHFVRSAADAGRDVVVLNDMSGGVRATLPRTVQLIIGDIGDRALLNRIIEQHRIGAVVHFAGKIQVGESVRERERAL